MAFFRHKTEQQQLPLFLLHDSGNYGLSAGQYTVLPNVKVH